MPLGILSGVMNGAMNFAQAENDRVQNERVYLKNQRLAFQQQQQAERNAVVNRRESLERAGLNPALAGEAQPLSTPVAHSPSTQAHPANIGASNKFTEIALLDAQKSLLQEQAREKRIDNNRKANEDSGAYQAMRSYAEAKLLDIPDTEENRGVRSYWRYVLNRDPESFNAGDINAEMRFKDLVTRDVDTTANAIKKSYENGLWKAYEAGKMPQLDINMKKAEIQKLFSVIGNLEANTLLLSSETALNRDKAKEIQANTEKLLKEAASIYHGDVSALWENKDYDALFAQLAKTALQTAIVGGEYALLGRAGAASKAGRVAGEARASKKFPMDSDTDPHIWQNVDYMNNPNFGKPSKYNFNKSKRVRKNRQKRDGFTITNNSDF